MAAKTLRTGETAPLFTARDLQGRWVDLADCYGHPTMIACYRSASCPLCNLRLWYLLRRHFRLYNYLLRLIVLFDSDPPLAHYYLDRLATTVPVIASHGQGVYDRYQPQSSLRKALTSRLIRRRRYEEAQYAGVGARTFWEEVRGSKGNLGLLPAEFLLTPTLQIARAHYGKDAGHFIPFADLDDFVAHYIR
jgi:thioredoxin-dependent peroxiredoxin